MAIDLTKNPNCYAYYLCNMSPSVKDMFYDTNCSLSEMILAVNTAVCKAKDTEARRRFLECLDTECFSKRDVEQLCSSAIARARNYQGK
jgi:hypothetical protein